MLTSLLQRLRLLWRKLWVRVVLISVLSIVAVLAAAFIGPLLPPGIDQIVGAKSVDQLLDILSSSMLAVTTFSLSVMVTIHSFVSSQWTPRAHRVQMRDQGTQMVLATFVGAFVYALVSIILRSAGVFSERDTVVLFATTLLVFLLVVVMLMRWLSRLQTMGSLADIAGMVEDLTRTAFRSRMSSPCLGARELTDDLIMPEGMTDVRAPRSGYVERIFPAAIEQEASGCGATVYLVKGVGDHVDRGEVLAHVTDASLDDNVLTNVQIGDLRDIEQDPGFGLLVLAEIAVKALSPGVNDIGTAVDMVDRMTGIVESWFEPRREPVDPPEYPSLYLPPLQVAPLILNPFGMAARDGANMLLIQQVIQSRLTTLSRHPDPDIARAAARVRDEALDRAMEAIPYEVDRKALRDHTASVTQTGGALSGTVA